MYRSSSVLRTRTVLLALLLPFIAACVTHVPLSTSYQGPSSLPVDAALPAEAVRDVPIAVPVDEQRRPLVGVTIREIEVRSAKMPDATSLIEYYDVDGDQRKPVVVLLPIFNGNLAITRFFARYFAAQGWAAVIVDRTRDPLDALLAPEATIRSSIAGYRLVLDWLETQPEIDSARIGLFGISLGAMDAVMLAALDHRVDALVVAMAGGDLPYVLLNTNYRRVVRTIDDMMADQGMTRDELRDSLDAVMETDPLALAPYVDAQRTLMIVTRTDAIVPFEAQEALRERLGDPETLYLPTGHRPSIVFFPKVRSAAFEFFSRQFATIQSVVSPG